MSQMLVSLLIRVRQDGLGALKLVRDQVRGLSAEKIGEGLGQMLAFGLRQGAVEAHNLKDAVAEAKKEGKELAHSLVHGTLGLAAGIYAFKKGFLDIAVEAEKARTRLKAIEESPGRAEAAMAVTEQFREKTATSLADVREAWIELRTRGIRPTDYTLTAIADTAAATGKKMADVAREIGGGVEGGYYRGLREYGIEAKEVGSQLVLQYRYLGKVIKEAVPKDNKLLVENKMLEILSKRYGGTALEASKGWEGLLLTMHEGWTKFALEVMDKGGVFAFMKDQLNEFVEGGKKTADGQSENAAKMASGLKDFIRLGFAVVTFFRDQVPGIVRTINSVVDAIGGWKVAIGGLVAVMAGKFILSLIGVIGPAIGVVVSAMSALIPIIVTLTGVVYGLGVALLTTPVGWIVMGIAAIVAAAWLLYDNWDEVVAFLARLWTGFIELLSASWSAVVGFLGRMWAGIVERAGEAWTAIKAGAVEGAAAFMSAWERVKAFFVDLWSYIQTGWDNSIGLITRGIDKVRDLLPSFGGGGAKPSGSVTAPGAQGSKAQVEGKLELEVTVKGAESGRITSSGSSGPIALDPTLGLAGGLL